MTMFTSKRPTCAGRTLDLPRKDRDIRYLRPLGNSDIARNIATRPLMLRTRPVHISAAGRFSGVSGGPTGLSVDTYRKVVRTSQPQFAQANGSTISAGERSSGSACSSTRRGRDRSSCSPPHLGHRPLIRFSSPSTPAWFKISQVTGSASPVGNQPGPTTKARRASAVRARQRLRRPSLRCGGGA